MNQYYSDVCYYVWYHSVPILQVAHGGTKDNWGLGQEHSGRSSVYYETVPMKQQQVEWSRIIPGTVYG